MKYHIVSWNMQGNGREKLSDSRATILCPSACNIILMQEAGVPDSFEGFSFGLRGESPYQFALMPQDKVKNMRCTVGAGVSRSITDVVSVVASNPAGTTRPIACVTMRSGLVIATMHAISGYPKGAKDEIARVKAYLDKQSKEWILMGDFNVKYEELVGFNTLSAKDGGSTFCTHPSSMNCLDYAIFSDHSSIKSKAKISILTPSSSDHMPIALDFEI